VSLACVLTTTLLACRHAPPALHTKPASASLRRLQHDVDAILSAPALERGYWGVLVRSLATGDTLYALNARKLMMPASTMKIVTLAAAAERLGWDYSYETDVAACGAIDRGTLDGDLLIIGSGDPTVTNDNAAALFDDWAERLKALGVKRISGRLVGDDNRFDHETLGMGWSWDDLQDGYAAGVSALQFNENAARLTIAPGPAIGAPAVVILEPATSGLVVHSLLTTSDAATAASIRTRRLPGSEIVELDGSMPVGAVARVETVSVDSPVLRPGAARQVVRAGDYSGRISRARGRSAECASGRILFRRYQPSIGTALRDRDQDDEVEPESLCGDAPEDAWRP
jgi:serine-type D-Ala-D-Ala carboxypeptidase/endopeptidase (penicillin-binding protein 4)